jgi:hypothetical protein
MIVHDHKYISLGGHNPEIFLELTLVLNRMRNLLLALIA